jgi:hypothetical protein
LIAQVTPTVKLRISISIDGGPELSVDDQLRQLDVALTETPSNKVDQILRTKHVVVHDSNTEFAALGHVNVPFGTNQ